MLSEATLPVVRPRMVTVLPVTSYKGKKPSLLTNELWVQMAGGQAMVSSYHPLVS